MTERRKVGRPRIGSAESPAQVLQQLMASGKPEVFVPELIEAIMGELRCSKRTGYRRLREALGQGTVKIGTTDSGTN